MASEGEECDGDEGFGAMEPRLDPGEQSDLGVGAGFTGCRL